MAACDVIYSTLSVIWCHHLVYDVTYPHIFKTDFLLWVFISSTRHVINTFSWCNRFSSDVILIEGTLVCHGCVMSCPDTSCAESAWGVDLQSQGRDVVRQPLFNVSQRQRARSLIIFMNIAQWPDLTRLHSILLFSWYTPVGPQSAMFVHADRTRTLRIDDSCRLQGHTEFAALNNNTWAFIGGTMYPIQVLEFMVNTGLWGVVLGLGQTFHIGPLPARLGPLLARHRMLAADR